ncbi:MAG: rod shape-determining protein MreC [Gammaproteobacteria bacterium]|nr:rod shape-determining protein MreC [Gammaproteobacteria bacterium]
MFTQGPSITFRAGLLLLASIALMTLDHRQQTLEGIRSGLSLVVYPMQYLVNLPFTIVDWAGETLSTHKTLLAQNSELRTRQLKLDFRLQKLAALEAENERLRALLQSASRNWERVLIAELLSVDFDPFKHRVLLNKGSRDGVFEGHPLLDARGVMGQVIHVTPINSTAILITDPAHAIPVQVNRNGLRALAVGTGENNTLDIPHLPNNADIEVGDLLVTSGLGLRFPSGYPVATVDTIRRDPGQPYAQISATPLAQLDHAREVLLVWPELPEVPE